jgi:hypothetical protein
LCLEHSHFKQFEWHNRRLLEFGVLGDGTLFLSDVPEKLVCPTTKRFSFQLFLRNLCVRQQNAFPFSCAPDVGVPENKTLFPSAVPEKLVCPTTKRFSFQQFLRNWCVRRQNAFPFSCAPDIGVPEDKTLFPSAVP